MITTNGNSLMEQNRQRRQRRKQVMETSRGMKYFCFGINYNNGPDVYEYFFRAKSAEEVSDATGVDLEYIYPCTEAAMRSAMRRGKHFDTVINGALVEEEA